eukprot:g10010.t1
MMIEREGSILKKREPTPVKEYGIGYDMEAIESHVEMSKSMKRAPAQPQLSVKEVQRLVQTKIEGISPRASDQQRKLHALFGRATELNGDTFKRLVERLGVTMTNKQAEGLFKQLDIDDSGGISLTEFLRGVMPKDLTARLNEEKKRKNIASFIGAPTFSEDAPLSSMIDQIRTRVDCRTSRSSDTVRQLMRRFQTAPIIGAKQRDSKINMGRNEFGDQLKILGINLTKKQVDKIFTKFDEDKSGDIDLIEFISNIHQDYTGESYFEKRPKSRSQKPKRMLGATGLRRETCIKGSRVEVTNPNPPSPIQVRELRRKAKQKKEKIDRLLAIERNRSNCLKREEEKEKELPETTTDDPTIISNDNYKVESSNINSGTNSLVTPKMPAKQRKKLEMLLAKSLGQQSKNPHSVPTKGRRVHAGLRQVRTQYGKKSTSRKQTETPLSSIALGSPRDWTKVLRSSNQVWTDTSSKPQYYSSKFKVSNAYKRTNRKLQIMKPMPPRNSKKRSPRIRQSTRSKESYAMRPEYVTNGGLSPRVQVVTKNGDMVQQTALPVIPNQRWVQQNFMAKV